MPTKLVGVIGVMGMDLGMILWDWPITIVHCTGAVVLKDVCFAEGPKTAHMGAGLEKVPLICIKQTNSNLFEHN